MYTPYQKEKLNTLRNDIALNHIGTVSSTEFSELCNKENSLVKSAIHTGKDPYLECIKLWQEAIHYSILKRNLIMKGF